MLPETIHYRDCQHPAHNQVPRLQILHYANSALSENQVIYHRGGTQEFRDRFQPSVNLCTLRLLTRSCITDCLYLLPRTFGGNPDQQTCVDGNAHESQACGTTWKNQKVRCSLINCQDKTSYSEFNANHRKSRNAGSGENGLSSLRPKCTKSDYNECRGVVGIGQTVSGLQMATNAFLSTYEWQLSWFCRFLWSIAVACPRVAAIAGATPSSFSSLSTFSLNQRNAKTRGCKGAKVGNHRIHQNQQLSCTVLR